MIDHQYQQPAQGILKQYDYGDLICYHIPCECMSDDDAMDMTIEIDNLGDITVQTHVTPKTEYWQKLVNDTHDPCFSNPILWHIDTTIRNIINGLYHRLNITYQVWTKGYVKYQHTTIMNKQQAFNYAETIKQAIVNVQRFKEATDELSRKNE